MPILCSCFYLPPGQLCQWCREREDGWHVYAVIWIISLVMVVGCTRYPIPEDYSIQETYRKCDSGTCKLVTETIYEHQNISKKK